MAAGTVPGAIYPDSPYTFTIPSQTLPDKFTPPAFWGLYPSFSGSGQTSVINTASPMPPWEAGPSYGPLGGQQIGMINANPVSPIGV